MSQPTNAAVLRYLLACLLVGFGSIAEAEQARSRTLATPSGEPKPTVAYDHATNAYAFFSITVADGNDFTIVIAK